MNLTYNYFGFHFLEVSLSLWFVRGISAIYVSFLPDCVRMKNFEKQYSSKNPEENPEPSVNLQ